MNISESECSSGCESGWTLYLEQSSGHNSPNTGSNKQPSEFLGYNNNGRIRKTKQNHQVLMEEEDEEEEDLSMVSDASSGPPHFHHHHEEEYDDDEENRALRQFNANKLWLYDTKRARNNNTNGIGKRQKMKEHFNGDDQDTASSSPLCNYSNMGFTSLMSNNNNNMDYSQGFSATHFQRKTPAFQDTYGYGFLQSSLLDHQTSFMK